MPLKKSLILFVVVALLLTLAAVACAPKATPTKAPESTQKTAQPTKAPEAKKGTPYKIGFLAAITGKAAFLGVPERDTALMIQEQINKAGGITGSDGVVHPVKIVIYDTEGSGDTAIPLAKKLIDEDKVVAIVGGTRSPVSIALVPVMQEAKIPFVSMASSSAIVEPVSERYWVFKTPPMNRHTAPLQAKYIKALGLSKVAVLYVDNAYGEDGRDAFRDAAKAEGLEITTEETFAASDTDMTAQLTKAQASGAEAVVVTALPPAASILTKQYRDMKIGLPLIHNHGVGMKPFIDLAGAENAEGVVFPIGKLAVVDSLSDNDPQKAVLAQFKKDYEAYTGKPVSTFAGHAWDGLHMVFKALEAVPDGTSVEDARAMVRDGLENIHGFVGTGGVFNMSPKDHVGLGPDDVVMVKVHNGEWVYYPPEEWGK